MPKDTDRLNLPLPLGNENVTRESINAIFEKIDAGVATSDELEALRQVIGEMDIPDASVTVKGKTLLSSATDSTLEDRAATPKAVNDAKLAAQKYTDDRTWQKYKLTQDNGDAKVFGSTWNLDNIKMPGTYYGAPRGVPNYNNQMYFIEVVRYTDNVVMQRATNLDTNEVYQRVCYSSTWKEWRKITQEENLWGAL